MSKTQLENSQEKPDQKEEWSMFTILWDSSKLSVYDNEWTCHSSQMQDPPKFYIDDIIYTEFAWLSWFVQEQPIFQNHVNNTRTNSGWLRKTYKSFRSVISLAVLTHCLKKWHVNKYCRRSGTITGIHMTGCNHGN